MTHARLDDQFDDEPYGLLDALSARYGHLLSKPSNIAWTVGAVVTVGFVFSNALFFQSGKHPAAIFETRVVSQNSALQVDELDLPVAPSEPDKEVTRIVYDTDTETRTQSLPKPLPTVMPRPEIASASEGNASLDVEDNGKKALAELQKLLAELGYYDGDLDGLTGPKTRSAIESYKANVGLKGIDLSYDELALSARNNLIVTAAVPKARPKAPAVEIKAEPKDEVAAYIPPAKKVQDISTMKSNTVAKVQAGLRAFGNETVSVDGVLGSNTQNAIKEFQSLFRLPTTGKIDEQLVTKMTAVGLIN
ncbi:peptidoglycan-binding protein [Ahrensia sp. 13_GOM-1096m]|uniref:peptidoglycan-binding domain-containing protein n=1 Tax=Ahrensia sp. 13_GOM-1096m TaxID=1380380 RepID=UPI00047D7454|nr:peptidoglycan-binding protein [Ahrensia sp. 13_GOM-1096m]